MYLFHVTFQTHFLGESFLANNTLKQIPLQTVGFHVPYQICLPMKLLWTMITLQIFFLEMNPFIMRLNSELIRGPKGAQFTLVTTTHQMNVVQMLLQGFFICQLHGTVGTLIFFTEYQMPQDVLLVFLNL